MSNSKFWDDFKEVNALLKKQAFIQMPGGQDPAAGGDPSMGGGAPMDPSMMGGDPSMGGGAPMDPSMMGGDPSMGGAPMDPSMMGGAGGMPPPGMDPSMMGGADPSTGLPPGMATPPPGMQDPTTQPAAPGSPMITISLDQLFDIIQKVLGLAKKVGVNGAGVQQGAPAAAPQGSGADADQIKGMIYEALANMGN